MCISVNGPCNPGLFRTIVFHMTMQSCISCRFQGSQSMKERVSIARCPRRGQYPFEDKAVPLGFGMIEEVQRTFEILVNTCQKDHWPHQVMFMTWSCGFDLGFSWVSIMAWSKGPVKP